MQRIEPPDSHHLRAAIGWIELGSRAEALKELAQISPPIQGHPDVLEARWILLAGEEQWAAALDVASNLVEHAPDRASGWLHRAYAMRRAPGGGVEKAWDALQPAADKFPKEPIISYNLSCYACQMNKLQDARVWFRRALKAGDEDEIRRMALADEDLKPLWKEIEQW